jgi:hypothetical protein
VLLLATIEDRSPRQGRVDLAAVAGIPSRSRREPPAMVTSIRAGHIVAAGAGIAGDLHSRLRV